MGSIWRCLIILALLELENTEGAQDQNHMFLSTNHELIV